jgi:hypothetical protein
MTKSKKQDIHQGGLRHFCGMWVVMLCQGRLVPGFSPGLQAPRMDLTDTLPMPVRIHPDTRVGTFRHCGVPTQRRCY